MHVYTFPFSARRTGMLWKGNAFNLCMCDWQANGPPGSLPPWNLMGMAGVGDANGRWQRVTRL